MDDYAERPTAEKPPPVPVPPQPEPSTPVATEPKPEAANAAKPSKSTIANPVREVWRIADEMKTANPNVTRKQVVDECVRRGIAFYTARTQYQRWSAKSRETL